MLEESKIFVVSEDHLGKGCQTDNKTHKEQDLPDDGWIVFVGNAYESHGEQKEREYIPEDSEKAEDHGIDDRSERSADPEIAEDKKNRQKKYTNNNDLVLK